MKKEMESNIWKYGVLLVANKRIFVAILGAYYLTIPDVTPKVIGIILLLGGLAGNILEIPSGYISDKLGHKKALIISRLLLFLSTLFYLMSNSVAFLIFGAVFMSAGVAFHSGTGSAFMHETLHGLKREDEYSKVMGRLSSIGFAIPILFMVLVPFLVSVSYKAPFVIALFVDLIGILVAFSLTTPPVPAEEVKEIGVTNFKQVLQEGNRLHFFDIALFSGIIGGTLIGVGMFRAPYQVYLQIPVIWFGVFFGIGRVLASVLLANSGRINKMFTQLFFYKFQLVIYTFLILVMGLNKNPWVVVSAFIIVNAFQWGLSQIDNAYQLNIIKTSKFKATLLSTAGQVDQIVAAASGFGIGILIDKFSYRGSFLLLGIILLIVLLPLYLFIGKRYRRGLYSPA